MKIPHIVLFTPFHPDFGGGATYFHSTLAALKGVKVTWAYLGAEGSLYPKTVCLGARLIGGPLAQDLLRSARVWLRGGREPRVRGVLDQLTQFQADAFWIVPMHEAIPVANALQERTGAAIHLSVQDDQCDAIAIRSRRYRHLLPWMRKQWLQLMRRARSIDVCSSGMKTRYESKYGLCTQVFHPYVPQMPALSHVPLDQTCITVGHLGSIYSAKEWFRFLSGLDVAAKAMRRCLKLRLIGPSGIPLDRTRQLFGDAQVEIISYLPEESAIPLLNRCDFLYAMYPFDRRSYVFTQTSLPSKLGAYLRAQRPVFAHCPADSTLSTRVHEANLGIVCTSLSTTELSAAIQKLVVNPAPASHVYEQARERYYGFHNVRTIQSALQALTLSA